MAIGEVFDAGKFFRFKWIVIVENRKQKRPRVNYLLKNWVIMNVKGRRENSRSFSMRPQLVTMNSWNFAQRFSFLFLFINLKNWTAASLEKTSVTFFFLQNFAKSSVTASVVLYTITSISFNYGIWARKLLLRAVFGVHDAIFVKCPESTFNYIFLAFFLSQL